VTFAAAQIVAAIRAWQAETRQLVVAIDGRGAAGKTTIAFEVAVARDALIVHTDDYLGDAQPTDDARPMAQYYDWEALRRDSLEPAIEWGSPLILVEGVSSAAPALADLMTHIVLVTTPEAIRLERLRARIKPEEWDEDWLEAERVYFLTRPAKSFDLIVSGSTEGETGPRITG
jgi:uridine kinase